MDYGWRAGMQVSITSMEGRDTAQAVISFRHTRDNALTFCRDYVRQVSEECVEQALAEARAGLTAQALTGNCDNGEFTDFDGVRYRFMGRNPGSGYFASNKYLIKDLADGEFADGSTRSRYLILMSIYRALCPAHAPLEIDATVVNMAGRDTEKAVIKLGHTRDDAIHACQQRGALPVGRVTEDCIQRELAGRISDQITADCSSGSFTDFYGNSYRIGVNTRTDYPASALKANITNVASGKIIDYFDSEQRQPMPVYRALCPAHAPLND